MLLAVYRTACRLGGPLIAAQLRRRVRRQKEDPARLGERLGWPGLARPPGPLVWLHGASVGESLSVLPLIDGLLARWPGLEVLVTTGTVTSARLMAERLPPRARHQFVPVDQPAAWRRFLEHWRPDAAVLVESELWPNLILEARARGIPLALVNARMSERSFRRWRRLPGVAARLLGAFEVCLAQSEADRARFAALGAQEVRAPGNLKLAAAPLPVDLEALEPLRTAIGDRPVWLAASTHPGEEEQILAAHRRAAGEVPGLLTVIAPRHPERGAAIAGLIEAEGLLFAQRSKGQPITPEVEVYLADTLGELGLFFRVARLAFIGGSLVPHGGHNPLEAARLGCPPLAGPHVWNFAEITEALLREGGARQVEDAAALAQAVTELSTDLAARDRLAERARAAAEGEGRVVDAILEALAPLLDRTIGAHHAAA